MAHMRNTEWPYFRIDSPAQHSRGEKSENSTAYHTEKGQCQFEHGAETLQSEHHGNHNKAGNKNDQSEDVANGLFGWSF